MPNMPHRLLFLGDRRISWEVLNHLASSEFRDAFDIRGLVTCPTLEPHYANLRGNRDYRFISNRHRANDEIADLIRNERVTLLLSVQYNWVLPPAILDAVGRNAFNLHNAKLPEYKGYNSVSHALLNDDSVYESTLHWMDDAVDSGDIAYIGTTAIKPDDHAYGLYVRTIDAAVDACTRLLADIREGKPVPRIPMERGQGTFYKRESVAGFADISHIMDAAESERLIRAAFFPPYNTAYRMKNGIKIPVLPVGFDETAMAALPAANAPRTRSGEILSNA